MVEMDEGFDPLVDIANLLLSFHRAENNMVRRRYERENGDSTVSGDLQERDGTPLDAGMAEPELRGTTDDC